MDYSLLHGSQDRLFHIEVANERSRRPIGHFCVKNLPLLYTLSIEETQYRNKQLKSTIYKENMRLFEVC